MGFYNNIWIECVNRDNFYPWPLPRDLDCAEVVAQHLALTSFQLQHLGYSSRTLSRLVKKGVLYRYKVKTPEGSLPSIFTPGYTAQVIAKLPVPRFPNMEVLRGLLMVNQVLVSILAHTPAEINIQLTRPVQIITINNPMGILVARDNYYPQIPLRYGLNQAIVIIPHEEMALPDLPFRYIKEEELNYENFDINYYLRNSAGLVPVEVNFERQDKRLKEEER